MGWLHYVGQVGRCRLPSSSLYLSSQRTQPPVCAYLKEGVRQMQTASSSVSGWEMKRFYETVGVQKVNAEGAGEGSSDCCWEVLLDGRPLRTPGRNPLHLPTEDLARAVAAEWESQIEKLTPALMPMMALAATAVDLQYGTWRDREGLVEGVLRFLQTDTALFKAEDPQLEKLQTEVTEPVLAAFETRFAVSLPRVTGIHVPTLEDSTIPKVREALELLDVWHLTALETAVSNTKSLVLSSLLVLPPSGVSIGASSSSSPCEGERERREAGGALLKIQRDGISAVEALRASRLEEEYQQTEWGQVEGDHDVEAAMCFLWLSACKNLAVFSRQTVPPPESV
uniref:Uncharacterized protein n=1 Tax=Chromera velia CCMP2878 TaxID=1169474 RepID=A0A0G4FBL5_9ALVE|eukprot:Cvel_16169.t1-p1 / transcript=Cvel_16169.t1 / gene=Cvel_16169 / organism=Chromera_velia_CCMP2878 / gene_product=ATP synthase mitochondrial F1 complex assembly, putative / transcript_product=ATP synthase mitochondrial F1 complex assembly, putative / location=Cvel_scaffold1232:41654-47297(-) / protein_length=339 / sequence_SO=supercontig / SO=protein_coding / is_pseudo=false